MPPVHPVLCTSRRRTLRDYVHFYQAKPGFQKETNDHLIAEAKVESLSEVEKHVVLLVDEMKVREDIVFDKNSGKVVGPVHLGDFNDSLAKLEKSVKEEKLSVATHVLGLIVRGLVSPLKFPYVHFPTSGNREASIQ